MTLTRSAVTYACETWILSVRVIINLLVFERQIVRKIRVCGLRSVRKGGG